MKSASDARQTETADSIALERILTIRPSLSGPDGRDWVRDAMDDAVCGRFYTEQTVQLQAAAQGEPDYAEIGRLFTQRVFGYIRESKEYQRALDIAAQDMVTPGRDDPDDRARRAGAGA